MKLNAIPGEDADFGALDDLIDEKLEAVSEELFKKGTLSGDTIDWPLVQAESTRILEQISHMLAFRGLILSLLENADRDGLNKALEVGAVLFSAHFPKLHPKGQKFQRKKINWATEIVATLAKAAKGGQGRLVNGDTVGLGNAFCDAAELHDLDVAVLRKCFSETVSEKETKDQKNKADADLDANADEPSKLDAKGRAQLRREIQTLAHKIFTNTPDAGISYQMRGFAGWMEFQFLPDADASGKTELQSMPSSVMEDHERSLPNATLKDLQRLEERLLSNPDWFEGHKLAAKMAAQLGLPTAAEAIRRRVADRLMQWDGLRGLKYSNDMPFVSDAVSSWLGEKGEQLTDIVEESAEANEGQGAEMNELLTSIDAEIAAAKSPRDKALAKLRLLREFKRHGHVAQARMMAEELCEAIQSANAKEWDVHLLKSIEAELN